MKALLCVACGPAETLVLRDIPEPLPLPGELLVRVRAAALNFFDTLIIQGRYQSKPDLPFSPCAEFSGEVAALGTGVSGFSIGQRVAGFCNIGAAREFVCVRPEQLVLVPESLSHEAAAGLFVTYGTSFHALMDRAHLKPQETLVVLGAAGGAGLSAVEIGAAMGARVIACASSPEKLELARAHGATETVNYTDENLRVALKRLTNGHGTDVLYDTVGGDLAGPAVRSMAWGGRYLVIGFAGGAIPSIALNLLLLKGCDMCGVFWTEFVQRHPDQHQAHMRRTMDWVLDGQLKARVHASFPVERAVEAFAAIAGRKAIGKVVLTL